MMDSTPTGGEITTALLGYLRDRLDHPALAYVEPPVRILGGFDTIIYAFRLASAPAEVGGPLRHPVQMSSPCSAATPPRATISAATRPFILVSVSLPSLAAGGRSRVVRLAWIAAVDPLPDGAVVGQRQRSMLA